MGGKANKSLGNSTTDIIVLTKDISQCRVRVESILDYHGLETGFRGFLCITKG